MMHTVYYLSDLAHAVSDSLCLPLHEAKERLNSVLDAHDPYKQNNQEE